MPDLENEPTLRDEISAAVDAVEKTQEETAAPEVAPQKTVEPQETPEAAPEKVEEAAPGTRERDEHGRFTKGQEKSQEAPGRPQEAVPGSKPVPGRPTEKLPAQGGAELRAPSSWRPGAREKWTGLPSEVKQEVVRLDREIRGVMQEAAQARDHFGKFREVIGPYEQMMRASGTDPMKEIAGLLHTANVLNNAPTNIKAQVVANLITAALPGKEGFEALDRALAAKLGGQPMDGGQAAVSFDPRSLAQQIKQEVWSDIERRAGERSDKVATQSVEEFRSDPSNEFYEDVKEDMADLLELYGRRGVELSIKDAYNLAVKMNPEIETVIKQRQAVESVRTAKASTQRMKAASSSVRSTPATGPRSTESEGGLRDDIIAAMEQHEG